MLPFQNLTGDPNKEYLADGLAAAQLGRVERQVDFDWAGADASFRRAMALDPGNPEHLKLAAEIAAALSRPDEALALTEPSN